MKKTDYVFAIKALERMAHIAMSPNGWLPSPSPWRVTMSWKAAHNLCGEREFWKVRDMTDYIDFLQGVIFG